MEMIELKKSLKSTKPAPCYVCYGDDGFLVERAVGILTSLAGELKPFDLVDREIDGVDLIEELARLPMMSEYRVVVARGKIDVASVEKYLADPNPTSVLVIPHTVVHDSWRKNAEPSIPKGAVPVVCNRLSTAYVAPFVREILKGTGATIDERAVRALYDRCGGYMSRINAEAQRLGMMCAGRSITEADIAATVKPDTEFVVFELCDCILAGRTARALQVVDGMAKNNDLVAAFTLLYNRFRRLFAAAVDPDGLEGIGVSPKMTGKLKSESARFSKAKLKGYIDMLEKADNGYKTGATTVYDALTGFVVQASYGAAR